MGVPIRDEAWNAKRGAKKRGRNEYYGDSGLRKGNVVLAVNPVGIKTGWESLGDGSCPQFWYPIVSIDLFSPPSPINICDFLDSVCSKGRSEIIQRLYFSPNQFPTPTNLGAAGGIVCIRSAPT